MLPISTLTIEYKIKQLSNNNQTDANKPPKPNNCLMREINPKNTYPKSYINKIESNQSQMLEYHRTHHINHCRSRQKAISSIQNPVYCTGCIWHS